MANIDIICGPTCPVESVINNQRVQYYAALRAADKASDATEFVVYMLNVLLSAMLEINLAPSEHQVGTKYELTIEQQLILNSIISISYQTGINRVLRYSPNFCQASACSFSSF